MHLSGGGEKEHEKTSPMAWDETKIIESLISLPAPAPVV